MNETDSGLAIRKWVDRVVELLTNEGNCSVGPVMCKEDGSPLVSFEVDTFFKQQVEKVQTYHPDLIEPRTKVHDDFSIFRSLRKGSESRATEVGVPTRVIDLINRWRRTEGRKKHSMPMRDFYLDMMLVKRRYLIYSKSL